ncbi:MAG: gamma carbonic anhydrase family protein [Alphaproteobacteria bacterium]
MKGLILPYRNYVPVVAADAFLAPGSVVIGNVEIGAESSIWFNAVIRGDVQEVKIGERTNLQDGCVVHVTTDGHATYIGSDVTVGHNAIVHACTIEDGVLIGMAATVMDGVVVEQGAMVAAGALVTYGKRVRARELWAGSPARCVRKVTDEEREQIDLSARNYVKLAQEYREALAKCLTPGP